MGGIDSHRTPSMTHRFLGVLVFVMTVTAGCTSKNTSTPPPVPPQSAPASSVGTAPFPLVGRWQMVTTCQRYVNALNEAGLEALAPGVLAGNGWMPGSAEQLAKKSDICQGAVPSRVHSHFFNQSGQFGSVDWRNQQVDNGKYKIINDHTMVIGQSTFRYSIRGGSELTMHPLIPAALKRTALANPMEFSEAGWMVAVALPGYTWKRVSCEQWC